MGFFICSADNSLAANNSQNSNKTAADSDKTIEEKKQTDEVKEDEGKEKEEEEEEVVVEDESGDPMRLKILQNYLTSVLLRNAELSMALLSLNEANTVSKGSLGNSDDELY
ncbi:MAG: hypothetical protein LBG13_03460 [Holosporales bacterium]|nr:hypothetical protein [Holosporales bacterium]